MNEVTLHAWGRPLSQDDFPVVSNVDHTWVTTFPEIINPDHQPDPPPGSQIPKSYWYCWGVAHAIASYAVGSAEGNVGIANKISPSNETAVPAGAKHYSPSSTSGAIVYYGLDGVCHQVANEILCATGTGTTEPIRVQKAKGYSLSTFFFGTYGLNTDAWNEIQNESAPKIKLPGDDFLLFMEQYVPADQRAQLLSCREAVQQKVSELRSRLDGDDFDFYPELTLIVFEALHDVKKLLGDDVFDQLFPSLDLKDEMWFRPIV
jgi:hypothetical protein